MKIAIDAGHGGKDPGAVGPGGLEEAGVVLDIAKRLSAGLLALGFETCLSRAADVFVELGARCEIANDWDADLFVSIHCNSDGPEAVGIETLYKSQKGLMLASPVQRALIEATGDRDRGLKYRADLYVLNGTIMPAILAEVGFISHPATEARLATEDYRALLAKTIASVLADYGSARKPRA